MQQAKKKPAAAPARLAKLLGKMAGSAAYAELAGGSPRPAAVLGVERHVLKQINEQDEAKKRKADREAQRLEAKQQKLEEKLQQKRQRAEQQDRKREEKLELQTRKLGFASSKTLHKSQGLLKSFFLKSPKPPAGAPAGAAAASAAGPVLSSFLQQQGWDLPAMLQEVELRLQQPQQPDTVQEAFYDLVRAWRAHRRELFPRIRGRPPPFSRKRSAPATSQALAQLRTGGECDPQHLPEYRRKLLWFGSDSNRPPFYGSHSASRHVHGRRYLARDPGLDYEVMSDQEWEEEPEGEDIDHVADDDDRGADAADEPQEEEDGFVVADGYLSDDECSGAAQAGSAAAGVSGQLFAGMGDLPPGVDEQMGGRIRAHMVAAMRANRPCVICARSITTTTAQPGSKILVGEPELASAWALVPADSSAGCEACITPFDPLQPPVHGAADSGRTPPRPQRGRPSREDFYIHTVKPCLAQFLAEQAGLHLSTKAQIVTAFIDSQPALSLSRSKVSLMLSELAHKRNGRWLLLPEPPPGAAAPASQSTPAPAAPSSTSGKRPRDASSHTPPSAGRLTALFAKAASPSSWAAGPRQSPPAGGNAASLQAAAPQPSGQHQTPAAEKAGHRSEPPGGEAGGGIDVPQSAAAASRPAGPSEASHPQSAQQPPPRLLGGSRTMLPSEAACSSGVAQKQPPCPSPGSESQQEARPLPCSFDRMLPQACSIPASALQDPNDALLQLERSMMLGQPSRRQQLLQLQDCLVALAHRAPAAAAAEHSLLERLREAGAWYLLRSCAAQAPPSLLPCLLKTASCSTASAALRARCCRAAAVALTALRQPAGDGDAAHAAPPAAALDSGCHASAAETVLQCLQPFSSLMAACRAKALSKASPEAAAAREMCEAALHLLTQALPAAERPGAAELLNRAAATAAAPLQLQGSAGEYAGPHAAGSSLGLRLVQGSASRLSLVRALGLPSGARAPGVPALQAVVSLPEARMRLVTSRELPQLLSLLLAVLASAVRLGSTDGAAAAQQRAQAGGVVRLLATLCAEPGAAKQLAAVLASSRTGAVHTAATDAAPLCRDGDAWADVAQAAAWSLATPLKADAHAAASAAALHIATARLLPCCGGGGGSGEDGRSALLDDIARRLSAEADACAGSGGTAAAAEAAVAEVLQLAGLSPEAMAATQQFVHALASALQPHAGSSRPATSTEHVLPGAGARPITSFFARR